MPVQQIDSIKSLKAFQYANDPDYWPKKIEAKNVESLNWLEAFLKSGWPKIIFYVFLVVILSLVLYRLLTEQNMLLFTKKSTSRKRILFESETHKEPELDKLLMRAEAERNYNEAVRLQYLTTLRLLNSKGLINYHPEWTNAAYFQQLKKHPHIEQFRQLSKIYEFVCYGGFTADSEKYQRIKLEFLKFHQVV